VYFANGFYDVITVVPSILHGDTFGIVGLLAENFRGWMTLVTPNEQCQRVC